MRIPVTLDTSGVEGQARRFVSQVERMAQQAQMRMAGGRPGDNAAQRILEQTRRQAEQQERLMERSAKKIADTQTREAKRGADAFLRNLKEMQSGSERTASATSGVFTKFLGAAFFADLAARAVSAFFSKGKEFISRGIELASEAQRAFLSAGSKAAQFGISDADTQRTIKNLTLVKSGMVSAADAAVAYRNVLARFTPEQSVALLERFADTLAFGKREAIGYGEALKAGTQGLKNLESQTVDNLGFGKNLDTMMREHRMRLQDLDEQSKKNKATGALYNSILKETAQDQGNAARWAGTYSGALAQQEVAQNNLQRAIGQFIITNPAHLEAIKIVTEQLTGYTTATGAAGSETEKLANQVLFAWDVIKTNTLPFVAFMANIFKSLGNAVASGMFGIVAVVTKTIETAINGIIDFVKVSINLVIEGINKVSGIAKMLPAAQGPMAGLQALPTLTPFQTGQNPAFLDSGRFLQLANEYGAGANAAARGALTSAREGRTARERLYGAASRGPVPVGGAPTSGAAAPALEGGAGGKAKKVKEEAQEISLALVMQALNEFRQQTGINLPISAQGQSRFHQRRGLDHRNAVDIALHPNTPEGRLLTEFLEAQGVPFLAYTRAVAGQATGPHIHAGHRSRGLGRRVSLTQQRQLDEAAAQFRGDAMAQRFGFEPRFDRAGERLPGFDRPVTSEGGIQTAGIIPRLTSAQAAAADMTERWREQVTALHDRVANFGQELETITRSAYLDWLQRGMNLTAELTDTEQRLLNVRRESADDQLSEQRRLLQARQEELDLTEQLVRLQDEHANAYVNVGLRAQIAAQEELNALQREGVEAAEMQARAQVRLADSTTYRAEVANAKVLDFLASQRSVTEVISDARINVIQSTYDLIDRGLDRMTRKLGLVGSVLKDLISGFVRLALNRAFQSMMLGGGQGGGVSFGGGGGGGLLSTVGNFIGGLFGARRGGLIPTGPGGTPAFNPANPLGIPAGVGIFPSAGTGSLTANDLGWLMGGGIGVPPSSTGGVGGIGSVLGSTLGGGGLFSNFSLSGLGAAAAPMLPLLGLSLGAGLGGPSRLGGVLGGIGGGLLGGAAAAFLAPGLFGLGSGGALGGAAAGALGGSAGGLGATAAAFLTNPFTIAAGGALLVGAYFIGRNRRRRQEEQIRDEFHRSHRDQIYQLIEAVKRPNGPTLEQARQMFDQIEASYLQQANQLRDSKTRRIAIESWKHLEALWPQVEAAALQGEQARAFESRFTPTFKDSGAVWHRFADGGALSNFARSLPRAPLGHVPGPYDRSDPLIARFSGDEVILAPKHWRPLQPALKAMRVPGFADSGAVGASAGSTVAPVTIQATIPVYIDGKLALTMNKELIADMAVGAVANNFSTMREDGLIGTLERAKRSR